MVIAKTDYSFGFLERNYVMVVKKFPDFWYVNLGSLAFVTIVVDVPGEEL